jgi:hypothetical protein
MYGGLSDRSVYGYPAEQYHPDDPDGNEGTGVKKPCHLAMRLVRDLRDPMPKQD